MREVCSSRQATKAEALCRNGGVSPRRQPKEHLLTIAAAERDVEVVVVGAQGRQASEWSTIMRDNGGSRKPAMDNATC